MPVLAPTPAPNALLDQAEAERARQLRLTECPACAAADRTARGTAEVLCESCAEELVAICRDCGLRTTGGLRSPSGLVVCPQCLPYHDVCEHCPELLPLNWRRCGYCDDDPLEELPIHPDDYCPTPVFHGRGPLYLGVELELWANTLLPAAAALSVDRLGPLAYLKADGSLGGRGFEIVTHPMSYEFACGGFPWRLLDDLRELGCFTTTDTGLHIHLSRDGFDSTDHTYRWLRFLYDHDIELIALARRSSTFAQFTDHTRAHLGAYAKGHPGNGFRGNAVNFGNSATFELRIFASTLNPHRARAALAFAAASVTYTAAPATAASWAGFTDWLATQPAYEPLLDDIATITALH